MVSDMNMSSLLPPAGLWTKANFTINNYVPTWLQILNDLHNIRTKATESGTCFTRRPSQFRD
eukprot:3283362-Amphidinium_carterae.1